MRLFGGRIPSGASNETWEWDGSSWTQILGLNVLPAAREDFDMVQDLTRGMTVLYGGAGNLADTWVGSFYLPGDLDGDQSVGLSDLAAFLSAFGSCIGDPSYRSAADLDVSGCVDLSDLSQFLMFFGTTCP